MNPVLEAHKARIASLRAEIGMLEAEQRGMEMILAGFPTLAPPIATPVVNMNAPHNRARAMRRGRVGGKQPGSLSVRWQETLKVFHGESWWSVPDIVEWVEVIQSRKVKPTEVRRLFAGYLALGYVELNEAGQYRVTDVAAQRFNFENLTAPNGAGEVGAPTATPNGAPSPGKEGVRAPSEPPSTPNHPH